MASPHSVVRIGPFGDENISAKLLKDAILSHFEDVDADTSTLTISNKYFSAKVVLEPLSSSSSSQQPGDNNEPERQQAIEDGAILVFDHNTNSSLMCTTSFDSLAAVHQSAQDADTCGDLLRLCVGVSPEAVAIDDESEYSRRVLWCLDHGYEYVQADMSPAGRAAGHDVRDKDGFARIVEAIRGTVWSSAVHHKNGDAGKGAKSKAASLLLGSLEKEEKEDTKVLKSDEAIKDDGDYDEDGANRYEPPDPTKFNMSSLIPPSDPSLPTTDTERVFDEMEALLQQATRIRKDSRNGEMTDDERRQRAGDAAMALVNLMDKFGLDEDEDGDESDENSLSDE